MNPLSLRVRLRPGLPLATLDSPHHALVRRQDPGHEVLLTLAEGAVPADRDFELTWRPALAAAEAVLFHEAGCTHDYVMAMLAPPDTAERPVLGRPREVIHVIDTSGSMGGASVRQARAALTRVLDALGPADSFNIVRFANDHSTLFPTSRPATADAVAEARTWAAGLAAAPTWRRPCSVRSATAPTAREDCARSFSSPTVPSATRPSCFA